MISINVNTEFFTKTGTFHMEINTENQDYFLHKSNDQFEIITLADGVSACANSKTGARIACEAVMNVFLECGFMLFDYPFHKISYMVLKEVTNQLKKVSEIKGDEVDSFASTLTFAVFDKKTNRLLTFQLGDSNLYLLSDSGCKSMVNQKKLVPSFTVYGEADEKAVMNMYTADELNGVLICSDGAWKEFYEHTVFNSTLQEALKSSDFSALQHFLESKECADDCSYILMNFNKQNSRNIA